MLIEMVESKQDKIKVIEVIIGNKHIKILSNCFICHSLIKGGDTYVALCNMCGASMTSEQRLSSFQAAQARFPELTW